MPLPRIGPPPPAHAPHSSSGPHPMTDSVAGIADTRGHYRRQRSLYVDDLTHFLARSP